MFDSWKGFKIHGDNFDRSDRAGRNTGGKRVNPLLWSEEAMKGVLNDQPDRIEDAMLHPIARINTRVTGGENGGPHHFFSTGIFTHVQQRRQTELVQQVGGARSAAPRRGASSRPLRRRRARAGGERRWMT